MGSLPAIMIGRLNPSYPRYEQNVPSYETSCDVLRQHQGMELTRSGHDGQPAIDGCERAESSLAIRAIIKEPALYLVGSNQNLSCQATGWLPANAGQPNRSADPGTLGTIRRHPAKPRGPYVMSKLAVPFIIVAAQLDPATQHPLASDSPMVLAQGSE